MGTNFTIVGGDLRIIKLANMLATDGNTIYAYGVEKAEELKENANIIICDKLIDAVKNSEIIIGPIPFSSNGKDINSPFSDNQISIRELMHVINAKILIAGSLTPEVYSLANDEYIEIIDLMKREELAVLNTISTAEGAIEIIIANTNKIIHGSKVLILGFGRIGKVLARKLIGLSAKVTCAARKDEDLAWIKAYGYDETNINAIGENLAEYDVIVNTVPHLILTEERLKYVKDDCLLVDLASNPGGIDKRVAKNKKLKLIWALALPGKVAPTTTAEFIKETVYNVLKEIYKK
ncbi:MAG: dipicolinate synthase subunit DpsA [Clostridia bacterium]|nr:dipicolinate synthase subunit DpsA [Clostridia bacterium]